MALQEGYNCFSSAEDIWCIPVRHFVGQPPILVSFWGTCMKISLEIDALQLCQRISTQLVITSGSQNKSCINHTLAKTRWYHILVRTIASLWEHNGISLLIRSVIYLRGSQGVLRVFWLPLTILWCQGTFSVGLVMWGSNKLRSATLKACVLIPFLSSGPRGLVLKIPGGQERANRQRVGLAWGRPKVNPQHCIFPKISRSNPKHRARSSIQVPPQTKKKKINVPKYEVETLYKSIFVFSFSFVQHYHLCIPSHLDFLHSHTSAKEEVHR